MLPPDHPRRKLLFHIGHHKTGSTSIQDAFATGRVTLTGGRILYPGRMNHNYLRRHFETYAAEGRVLPGSVGFPGLQTISERLLRGNFDVAVISAEEFEGADPQMVRKMLEQFMLPHVTDHAVICYVRPHAERILSNFSEDVKLGFFVGTPENYLTKALKIGRFFYVRRLLEWDRVFKGHFQLRPMIRSELAGGSVLRDFVETGFGADYPATISEATTSNESLFLEDLLLIKLVQDALAARDRKVRHAMGWQIAPALAAAARPAGTGTRLMLHKALAERIRATYRADAMDIDRRFFDGKPLLRTELDRAVDEALPEAQSFEPTDHFSAETLRVVSVLCDQINQLLDHEAGPWHGFLVERRIARLHGKTAEPIKPKVKPKAEMRSGDGTQKTKPDPQKGKESTAGSEKSLSLGTIERLVGKAHDTNTCEILSRRLGNILMQTPIESVHVTARDFNAWLNAQHVQDDVRSILEEFLLHLFFYDFSAEITGLQRNKSPEDLAAINSPVGQVLQRLMLSNNFVSEMAKAGIHYLRGDLLSSYDTFDLARKKLQADFGLHHHNRGLMSLRSMPILADWAARGSLPELPDLSLEDSRTFKSDLPLVVVGMDAGYYSRYAARLVETAQNRVNLHFHVANPLDTKFLSASHVRHSSEIAPKASNAYYATMRFLRLPALLTHYRQPIVTADADAFFIGSVAPLFDHLAKNDIVLNAASGLNQPRRHLAAIPWRHVTAQITVSAPTHGALEFWDIFARLYAGLTQANVDPTWWVDQALLSETLDVCRYEGRAPRVKLQWLHPVSGIKQNKL